MNDMLLLCCFRLPAEDAAYSHLSQGYLITSFVLLFILFGSDCKRSSSKSTKSSEKRNHIPQLWKKYYLLIIYSFKKNLTSLESLAVHGL